MTAIRYGKRFCGAVGSTQTLPQLHGLDRAGRKKRAYFSSRLAELKAGALDGDAHAERQYRKLLLAAHSNRSRKPVTKVQLKCLEEDA